MKRKQMKISFGTLIIFLFILLVLGQTVLANESQHDRSVTGLITLIEQYESDGAFVNNAGPRALKIHLTAINHYERQGELDKAIEHMENFGLLLDHQLENEFLSNEVHQTLATYADSLLRLLKGESGEPLAIVKDGQAHAVIVKPVQSSSAVNEAVHALADYVERATRASLSVHTIDEVEDLELEPNVVTIRIGEGSYGEDLELSDELDGLHSDGFIIAPHHNELIITSPTEVGTRNGVYAFLEKYVGITWLFPGEEWTHVPELNELWMPTERWIDEPTAFTMRRTMNMGSSSYYGDVRLAWQRQNRMISASEIRIGHNLYNIFPVEQYGDPRQYPNFYHNNTPPESRSVGWQPCFSNPATVDVAVEHIKDYFKYNPEEISFSLAVNDSGAGGTEYEYCEMDPNHEHYPGKINSVGWQHLSEIYYQWVNDVVAGVTEEYPDKWFTLYAYNGVMDPPEFNLHPQVIPVVTKDRLAWVDLEVEAQGKAHFDAWGEKANQLGWYDYMLSGTYPLPRVYPHMVEELYEYALEQDVLVHHWDAHNVLGDGPQPWIIGKLGWSMEQDVDTLLDHWYETAVGPAAAADLRQYFEMWEQFWMTEATDSTWFSSSKNSTYLSMRITSYLAYAREQIIQSRHLLESVLEKTQTPEQRKRAEQLLHQFEYYEVSTLSYPRQIDKPSSDGEVLALLDDLKNTLEARLEMVKRRYELIEEYNQNPTQRYNAHSINRNETWTGWNGSEFWYLKGYLQQCETCDLGHEITQRIHLLKQNTAQPNLRIFTHLLDRADIAHSLAEDPSFEEPDNLTWNKWNPDGSSQIEVTDEASFSGASSMRIESETRAGVWKYVDVQPGLLASSVHFYTPEHTTSRGTVQIVIELHAGSDKLVYYSEPMILSEHAGEWTEVMFLEEMPAQINGRNIDHILINTQILNARGAVVYLDDMGVYQVQIGVADLIDLVDHFITEGRLPSNQAEHLVSMLQSAEEKWQESEISQYVGLLVDFIAEASRLHGDGLLGEVDYHTLVNEANVLIKQQVAFHLSNQELHVSHIGTYTVPVTITNNHSKSLDVQLSSFAEDGIGLEFEQSIIVPAGDAITVEGTLRIPEGLAEGDYVADVHLELDGKKILSSHLNISYNTNLLPNPSFEDVNSDNPLIPMDWAGISEFEHSTEQVLHGNYALKLSYDPNSNNAVSHRHIEIIPGAEYRLSGWIYSEHGQAQFGLRQSNAADVTIRYDYTPVSSSSTEWQYFELVLTPQEAVKNLQVYLRVLQGAETSVWFDDMRLEIVPIPTEDDTNLLPNPSFEKANPDNPLIPMDWAGFSEFEHSAEQVHHGNYALKLSYDSGSNNAVSHNYIAIIPGAEYRLSGWIYSEHGQAQFGLRQSDAAGGTVRYDYIPASLPSAEWQYFELELTPQEAARNLQVYLRISQGAGTPVWFDDMRLEVVDTP